ncbi:hypothetical protein MMC07_004032 [Pseudocyphellaria aurata]|nr:hypothetical protein [Pseudocyphellaria aurata]
MVLRSLPAQYTRDQLSKLGFWDYPGAAASNLTYPIHPLFARERFEDPFDFWNEIKTSLRLASAILETSASVAFLYSLMNQPHILLEADTERLGQKCTQFWPSNQPENIMRKDVNRKLQLLIKVVSWDWDDNSQKEDSFTWAYTMCDLPPSVRLEMGPPGSGKKGFRSKISMGLSQTRKFLAVKRRNPSNFKNLSHLLRFQFLIAASVCHEIVHALGHAMWDDPFHFEPYYCDQRLNELGFAWETAVFGGSIIDTLESQCYYPLVTSTWPSLDNGEDGLVDLREPKRRMKCYFIPMKYINDIQQQAFWDQPSSDINLLRVPRLVGYMIRYKRKDFDKDWRTQDTSDVQKYMNARKQIIKGECRQQ